MVSNTLPLGEPLSIVRGDSEKWRRNLPDYPAPTWTLNYAFVREAHERVTHAATDYGDGSHLVSLTPTITSDLEAGLWRWAASVTDNIDRFTVSRGVVMVEPDYLTDSGFDPRSFAERMVDILRSRLEGRARSDVVQHSIEGFSMSVMSDADARLQLRFWEQRVRKERDEEAIRAGQPRTVKNKLYVRMS